MADRLYRRVAQPLALLGALALAGGIALAADPNPDESWRFTLTPYLWGAGLDGDLTARNRTVSVEVGFDDILDALDFGAAFAVEARQGDWAVLTDLMYLKLSADAAGPRGVTEAAAEVEETLVTAGLARTLLRTPTARLDLLGGLRYVHLKSDLDLDIGPARVSALETKDWVDPIIGLQGRVELGQPWFLPFYFDVGGFGVSSDLTWQALAGVGYGFSWGDVLLVYRHLEIDYEDGSFGYDAASGGLALGAAFRF